MGKISERTPASILTGDETLALIQAGFDRRATLAVLTANFVTPERYGAVGDGATDDTAAMQAALDSGAPAIFAKNSYYITTTLELQQGQTLYGEPKPTNNQTVVNATHPARILYRGSANTVAIKNGSGQSKCGVQDLMIDMNDNGSTALQFTGGGYHHARRVLFIGTMRLGLLADNVYVSDFEDLIFGGASVRTACVFLGLANSNIVKRIHTSSTYPNDAAECLYGIAVTNGGANRIQDCVFQGPTIGIATNTGGECLIDNPYFENCLCNMRLGNLGATQGKIVVNGGQFSAPAVSHPQYANRGPVNILACANATFMGPSFEVTAANAAGTGPWPFVLDSCSRLTIMNPYHYNGTTATYGRDLVYRRVSGSNTGLTMVTNYNTGTNYNATELILKDDGQYGTLCHGIRVDAAGTITAVAYQPAVIFADIDALLRTNLPTGASLVI